MQWKRESEMTAYQSGLVVRIDHGEVVAEHLVSVRGNSRALEGEEEQGRRGHADEVATTMSSGTGPDRATRSRGREAVRCHPGGYQAGRLTRE